MRILLAIVFFYLTWKGLDEHRTGLMFFGIVMTTIMLLWEMYARWSVFI